MSKRTIDGLVVRENASGSPQRRAGGVATARKGSAARNNTARKSAAGQGATRGSGAAQRRSTTDGFLLGPTAEVDEIWGVDDAESGGERFGDDIFGEGALGDGFDDGLGLKRNRRSARLEDDDEADWSDLLDQVDGKSRRKRAAANEFEADNNDWADEDEELKPTKKQKRKARKKRPRRKIGRVILIIILLLLVGGGAVVYFWGDAIISKLTNGNSGIWDTIVSMVSDEVPFETDINGRTNVLVFGTEGYDMAGTSGENEHAGSQLTDSLMVISFNQETKDVALISLPRDLKVSMACMAGKINEVFTCHNPDGNDEEAGVNALQQQIEEVLGITIQYWAHVNWASVVDIVNAIGGITVTLDEDISDPMTNVQIAAGVPTELDGDQAVALARSRYGAPNGDFSRGNSQQKIVEGIIQKFMENGLDFSQALNLMNILGDNLRTNFSSDNIKSGVSLMKGFEIGNIRNILLNGGEDNVNYVTTGMIGEVSFVLPSAGVNNYREIHAYIKQMLSNDALAREGGAIMVLNASDTAGVAGSEQVALDNEGFIVQEIGDANMEDCLERYCLFMIEDKPMTREKLEQRYGVVARTADELPSTVWPNGASFVLMIGAAEGE